MNKLFNLLNSMRWHILIVIIAIPTFISLVRPGYFPMHDDMQAMRVLQMDRCFQDGQIPCRWVPDMGYGYGYPQFIYYSPLPYYLMEFVHLLGFSFIASVKVVMALGFVFAGLAMFTFAKALYGKYGGLFASILYLYAPYRASDLYSRGAVAEFFGMIFLPLILYAIHQFITTKRNIFLIFLSLSYAGLLLSHNITTLAFTPLAAVFGLMIMYQNRRFYLLPRLITSSLLGIGLAAFFILPVVFEKPFAHIETMTVGYFNYLAHFVSFRQLFFSSFWGFGSSELGPFDDLTFTVGFLHWTFMAIALAFSFFYYRKQPKIALPTIILSIFFSLSMFMAHQRSTPIWNIIDFLKYFQFPWRFLVVATFTASAASGALIAFTKNTHTKRNLVIALSTLVILVNFNFFRPNSWINITDAEKFSGQSWDKQMTISIFDYLPIDAKQPPANPAPSTPTIVNGFVDITDYLKGSNWQSGHLNVISNDATITLPLFYFPGFTLALDGRSHPISYNNDLGLITFDVNSGEHDFRVELKSTPIRAFADLLTLFSIFTIIGWIIYEKNSH